MTFRLRGLMSNKNVHCRHATFVRDHILGWADLIMPCSLGLELSDKAYSIRP